MLGIGLVSSAHSGAGSRRAPWTPPTCSRRTTCATVTRASRASTRSATGLSWRGALPGRRVRGHAPAARAVVAAGPGRRRGPDPRHEADRKPGAFRPAQLGVVAASRYGGPDSRRSGGGSVDEPRPLLLRAARFYAAAAPVMPTAAGALVISTSEPSLPTRSPVTRPPVVPCRGSRRIGSDELEEARRASRGLPHCRRMRESALVRRRSRSSSKAAVGPSPGSVLLSRESESNAGR